jgi:hypothetical protein
VFLVSLSLGSTFLFVFLSSIALRFLIDFCSGVASALVVRGSVLACFFLLLWLPYVLSLLECFACRIFLRCPSRVQLLARLLCNRKSVFWLAFSRSFPAIVVRRYCIFVEDRCGHQFCFQFMGRLERHRQFAEGANGDHARPLGAQARWHSQRPERRKRSARAAAWTRRAPCVAPPADGQKTPEEEAGRLSPASPFCSQRARFFLQTGTFWCNFLKPVLASKLEHKLVSTRCEFASFLKPDLASKLKT